MTGMLAGHRSRRLGARPPRCKKVSAAGKAGRRRGRIVCPIADLTGMKKIYSRLLPLLSVMMLVLQSHFLTMKQIMGRDRAISLSLLGLVPKVEPWLLHLVQFWRASSLLGQELLIDYIKTIPPSNRTAFFKYVTHYVCCEWCS